MLDQITLNRKFKGLSECPFCHGVIFNFDEEVLFLSEVTEDKRKEIRTLVKERGITVEDLQNKFDDLRTEEFDAWECESCGHKNDSPKRGGS